MKNFFNSKMFVSILILLAIIISTITLKYYWEWFVSPIINIGEISFIQALGLNLVILFLKKDQNLQNETSSNKNRAMNSIINSTILLVIGYIVLFFM